LVAGKTKVFHLPGGGIEWGETLKQAIIRELYEETGLKAESVRYLFNYKGRKLHKKHGKLVKNDVSVFYIESNGHPKPQNEIKRITFWTNKRKLNIGVSTRLAINNYLTNHKNYVRKS